MRSRTTIAVLAAITSLVLVPAAAQARDNGSHGKRHSSHGKKQQKRHAKVRVKVLRTPSSRQYVDPTPATPTAGQVTVLSFTGGKLTLQHPDGTTAGRITDKTKISCTTAPAAPAPTTTTAAAKIRSDDHGDDNEQGGTTSAPATTPVVPGTSTTQGDDDENENASGGDDENENESGDDDGENGSAQSSSACDQSALTAGALIRRARIEITNGVATFDEIELLRPVS